MNQIKYIFISSLKKINTLVYRHGNACDNTTNTINFKACHFKINDNNKFFFQWCNVIIIFDHYNFNALHFICVCSSIKSCVVLQKSFAYIQIIKPNCKNAWNIHRRNICTCNKVEVFLLLKIRLFLLIS